MMKKATNHAVVVAISFFIIQMCAVAMPRGDPFSSPAPSLSPMLFACRCDNQNNCISDPLPSDRPTIRLCIRIDDDVDHVLLAFDTLQVLRAKQDDDFFENYLSSATSSAAAAAAAAAAAHERNDEANRTGLLRTCEKDLCVAEFNVSSSFFDVGRPEMLELEGTAEMSVISDENPLSETGHSLAAGFETRPPQNVRLVLRGERVHLANQKEDSVPPEEGQLNVGQQIQEDEKENQETEQGPQDEQHQQRSQPPILRSFDLVVELTRISGASSVGGESHFLADGSSITEKEKTGSNKAPRRSWIFPILAGLTIFCLAAVIAVRKKKEPLEEEAFDHDHDGNSTQRNV